MDKIVIKEMECVEPEYIVAVNALLKQLTSTPVSVTADFLKRMVASESSHLYFIYYQDEIAGMLTLGTYLSPTGPKSWVEDVVVDEKFRGHALGRQLVQYAIAEAGKIPGNVLMLTSKPKRVAANALYRSIGFQSKETNVYKMDFE